MNLFRRLSATVSATMKIPMVISVNTDPKMDRTNLSTTLPQPRNLGSI